MKSNLNIFLFFMFIFTTANANTIWLGESIEPVRITHEYKVNDWDASIKVEIDRNVKGRITSLQIYLNSKPIISKEVSSIIENGSPYYKDMSFRTNRSRKTSEIEGLTLSIGLNSGDELKDIINRKNDFSRALIIKIKINGDIDINYIEINKDKTEIENLY